MRRPTFLATLFALCLALATAGVAAADTTPGSGGAYGGLDVAVTSASVNPKTGEVSVSGLVTCEVDFDFVGVYVDVSQVVGRLFTIRGSGFGELNGCAAADGAAPFTTSFYADSGRFAPGTAKLRLEAYGEGGCYENPDTGDYGCENSGFAAHGPTTIRLGRAH